MIRLLPVLVLSLLAVGCKKGPASGGGSAEIELPKAPADEASQSFAAKMMKFQVSNWKPSDTYGASFVYKTVTFRPDNSWQTQAEMSADGESFECQELGTFEIDPAQDEHTAMVTWHVNKTTCAGRPDQGTMRTKINIDKGEYTIMFR